MSAILDFRDRMDSGGLVWTSGEPLVKAVNLFVAIFPVDPDDAVLLAKYPTPPPERVMGIGQQGIVYHHANIQVTVRAKAYPDGQAMMWEIIKLMDNFVGMIGTGDYKWINQRSGVADYGHDENKRFRSMATFMMHGSKA